MNPGYNKSMPKSSRGVSPERSRRTKIQNRYLLLEELQSGGFGNTFLAQDTLLPSQPIVVVKQMKTVQKETARVQNFIRDAFDKEAKALEILGKHDNIPSLFAYFQEDFCFSPQYYLVQEWIQGLTLTQYVEQKGKLSEAEAVAIAISLLETLDYVHEYEQIHGDIKPDNIIIRSSDNVPVLIDFGCVKKIFVPGEDNSEQNPTLIMCTPSFTPHEQSIGQATFSSDIYALGMTLIFGLTGINPAIMELSSDNSLKWRHQARVSRWLADIIDTAIAHHPSDRYHSVLDMRSILERGYQEESFPDLLRYLTLATIWLSLLTTFLIFGKAN